MLLLLGACGPSPQDVAFDDPVDPLQAYVTAEPDSAGHLHPYLRVALSRRTLVFYRHDEGIRGGLEVTVVAEREGRQFGGGVGRTEVVLSDWAATRVDSLVVCAVPLVVAGDDPVQLRVTARSLGSQRNWQRRLPYRPGRLAALPFAFSTFTCNLEDELRLGSDIDSLVCRIGIGRVGRVGAGREEPPPAQLGVGVTGHGGFERTETQAVSAKGPEVGVEAEFVLAATELPFGRLRILPFVAAGQDDARIVRAWQPGRVAVNHHIAVADDRIWRRHLDWLEHKFPADRLSDLRDLPPAERERAWYDLWQTAEEDPELARRRHLDLVVEADTRFAASKRGALTDRGRAWIRYGPPDEIDAVADDRTRGGRWEYWRYEALNLRLTFQDAHGLGDYRLLEKANLD